MRPRGSAVKHKKLTYCIVKSDAVALAAAVLARLLLSAWWDCRGL